MKLGVLCSGGKDSLFACYLAMQSEEVACLISVRSGNEESYMFHTPNVHLVGLQAEAAGLPLVSVETEGQEESELDDLRRAICEAVEHYGIEGVVTGALLSVYQATRVQRICRDLDLWCFNPLWYADQESYLQRLIGAGFKVVIAGVFSAPFDETWPGRLLDRDALDRLKAYAGKYGITLTGEGGEYETLVIDAPFFSKNIVIDEATTEYRNNRGIFRIRKAHLEEK
jgi:diphthine-ammonia ligase